MTTSHVIRAYLDRRILWVFLMGCASGFPWVLIGSAMSGWLTDAGLSRTAIGFFGSIFVVYAINFLWAPLLDRVKLPSLTRLLGQRRSWILITQAVMLIAVVIMTRMDPGANLLLTSLVALVIAAASATQDVAIDAFRIDQFADTPDQIPAASAMAVIGWWTGYSLPGFLAFQYADSIGWANVYWILGACLAALMLATCLVGEPASERDRLQAEAMARYRSLGARGPLVWLAVTVVEPLAEFFRRNGLQVALSILLFVFLFKIGEAFLGRMSIVFYKEVGFSNEQIAEYSKLIGWIATIGFTFLGSLINLRLGVFMGLMIGGIAMAASNLMFAWIALAGPQEWLFAATIIVDNFTTAFSSVAFVSFLTALTGRAFSATQYALLASLGNFGRTTLASGSGWVVDLTGSWVFFFVLTTVMVIPGLLLLWWIRRRVDLGTHSSPVPRSSFSPSEAIHLNAFAFLVLFLLPMILTYGVRFALFGAALDLGVFSDEAAALGRTATWLLIVCYFIMIVAAYFRGRCIARPYLPIFPFIGGLFDIVLVFIPLVPTVMNVAVIILAMIDNTKEKSQGQEAR